MIDVAPVFDSKYADKESAKIILQPAIHTAQLAESVLWPKLVKALNHWFKIPEDKLEKVLDLTRLIQITNNTLTDAAEETLLRKGVKTANSVFSTSDTLNSAYYCCFVILERLRELDSFAAIHFGKEYFLDSSKAQGMEVYWRDNIKCPTEEHYLTTGVLKTTSVIRLTIKVMQLFSENKSDFTKLTEILGKFFHIYDDYISLKSKEEYLLNPNGIENVSEGKFSFPIIHGIHNRPDDVQLINMLRQKPKHKEVLDYFLILLEKFGSFEYTRDTLQKLREELNTEMEKIDKNPQLQEIIENCLSLL